MVIALIAWSLFIKDDQSQEQPNLQPKGDQTTTNTIINQINMTKQIMD